MIEYIGWYFELCLDEPVFALHQGKTYKAKVGIDNFYLKKKLIDSLYRFSNQDSMNQQMNGNIIFIMMVGIRSKFSLIYFDRNYLFFS